MPGPASILRQALEAFASVVFPAPCRLCEEPLNTATRIPVCPTCLDSFQILEGQGCGRCGRPFPSALAAVSLPPLCHLCRRRVYAFDLARSYAAYDEVMARAITLFKNQGVTPLGAFFAERLAALWLREMDLTAADLVIPVPLDARRLRERGFNQAEVIARPLAKRLGLPLRSSVLLRTRPRPDQLRLTRQQRWRTVRGAYCARVNAEVDNLRVLLVDDVFTTGATLDACARALRQAGASSIVALTVARVAPQVLPASPAAERTPRPAERPSGGI